MTTHSHCAWTNEGGHVTIILATATCHDLTLATRNSRDFALSIGSVMHPYQL